jgi:hypothetical protein
VFSEERDYWPIHAFRRFTALRRALLVKLLRREYHDDNTKPVRDGIAEKGSRCLLGSDTAYRTIHAVKIKTNAMPREWLCNDPSFDLLKVFHPVRKPQDTKQQTRYPDELSLVQGLESHRGTCSHKQPEDLVFCTSKGTPLSPKNLYNRSLAPACDDLSVPRLVAFLSPRKRDATR